MLPMQPHAPCAAGEGHSTHWAPLPIEAEAGGALPGGHLPALLAPAVCAVGSAAFAVVGGFDGKEERCDLYLIEVCGGEMRLMVELLSSCREAGPYSSMLH